MISVWKCIEKTIMIAGYSRAAAELTRQGYHEEAKRTMMELGKLKRDL